MQHLPPVLSHKEPLHAGNVSRPLPLRWDVLRGNFTVSLVDGYNMIDGAAERVSAVAPRKEY